MFGDETTLGMALGHTGLWAEEAAGGTELGRCKRSKWCVWHLKLRLPMDSIF